MDKFRKLLAPVLALILVLPLAFHARAAETPSDDLIRQMLNYYLYYRDEAQTDYDLLLEEMEKQDPALAETWEGILDFWMDLNRDMQVHELVLPDGLPQDNSLCIVVMGFYLHADGSIRDELEQRLSVALASAEKYPNAYILCTGGGTAAENKSVTEAGQMAKWLTGHGIEKDRIITETKASSTIENATFGCRLLYREYPQIRSLAVITSDYHVRRSCLYFNTQAALDAYSSSCSPMQVVAGASCAIRSESETDVETQVEGMSILTGVKVTDLPQPVLSVLKDITVSADSGARAIYSSGLSRDISEDVTYEALETDGAKIKTVTVTYVENDSVKTTVVSMEDVPSDAKILLPSAEISLKAASVASTEEAPHNTVPLEVEISSPKAPTLKSEDSPEGPTAALAIGGVCVVLLAVLLVLKFRPAKKDGQ